MTPHAYFLLPLGLTLLLFSRRWLYRFVVVSTLFSGTAVFNLGSGDAASGVQLWMFFGGLWLVREAVSRAMRGKLSVRWSLIVPMAWLALFLFIAALSLIMPLYINGHLQIGSSTLTDNSSTPLLFSSRNITAWLYLAFGSLLAISIAGENAGIEKLEETGRIYLWAGTFVAFWGFFQVLCPFIGLTYPAFLFNNSASPAAIGYLAALPGTAFLRMSSVTLETSLMSQALLTVLPLTIPALLGRHGLISVKTDRSCAVLIIAALIATTSSSAYGGLVFLAVCAGLLAIRMGMARRSVVVKRGVIALVSAAGLLLFLYTQVPLLSDILDMVLFAKASSYSGLERLKTVELASGYFAQFPLLGVGWGSVVSHDLLFKLLANIGLIGFLSFAGLVLWLVLRLYRELGGRDGRLAMTQMVWLLALGVLIFTNALGGFAYVLGHMWFIFGMAIACAALGGRSMTTSVAGVTHGMPELAPEGTLV